MSTVAKTTRWQVRRRLWDLYGRGRVRRAVEQAIEAEGVSKGDARRLRADLNAWLNDDTEVAEFMDLPIGEVVARMCEGLGLALDWDLWMGQVWAIDYVGIEASGNLYAIMEARAVAAGLLRNMASHATVQERAPSCGGLARQQPPGTYCRAYGSQT